MTSPDDQDDPFIQLIKELEQLSDAALRSAWADNAAEFDATGPLIGQFKTLDELRQWHNALRIVIIQRFGVEAYRTRWKTDPIPPVKPA